MKKLTRHNLFLFVLFLFVQQLSVGSIYSQQFPVSKPTSTLTVQFTGMSPHMGEGLELRIVDKSNMKEVGRTKIAAIPSSDFNVNVEGILAGSSYWIDFYVDHNGNGRYDAPPADHTWRLELNNATGSDVVNFAHNTTFTDIKWKYMLTVHFTGMSPHSGQLLELRVIDDSTQIEFGRTRVESISSTFDINLPVLWSDRSEYRIEFYADANNNGLYDSPPTDHTWEVKFNNNFSDATVNFAHNTNLIDIKWKYLLTLNLLNMGPHVGELIAIRLIKSSDKTELSRVILPAITVANLSVYLPGLELNHDYLVDFYVDHNKNGFYDPPPTDHAWEVVFNSGGTGDFNLDFTHNTTFTDIAWPNPTGVEKQNSTLPQFYELKQNYPNPFNPTTKINFSVKEAGNVSLKVYNILGKEVASLINENLPAGKFNVEWNAINEESGIYFYTLQTQNFLETKKMILIK